MRKFWWSRSLRMCRRKRKLKDKLRKNRCSESMLKGSPWGWQRCSWSRVAQSQASPLHFSILGA
jgi:hypothetical protein